MKKDYLERQSYPTDLTDDQWAIIAPLFVGIIATDTLGCLLALKVHKANLHDSKSGIFTALEAYRKYPTIRKYCADSGYRGSFINNVKTILDLDVDISAKIIPQG